MRRTFFTGIAILLPITITFFILKFLVDFFTKPFTGVVEDILSFFEPTFFDPVKHRVLLEIASKILIIFLIIMIILILGFIGERFIFHALVKRVQNVLLRIPLVKNIFRITQDVTSLFLEKKEKLFKKTVVVPFPHLKANALGLLTSKFPKIVENQPDLYSIFVPTAPHPISGFLVLMPEKEMQSIDVSPEEVFKFLVSCGVYEFDQEKQSDLPQSPNSTGQD